MSKTEKIGISLIICSGFFLLNSENIVADIISYIGIFVGQYYFYTGSKDE